MEGSAPIFIAPPYGTFDHTFTLNIDPGSSVVFTSSGKVTATASASRPSGSATAIAIDSIAGSFLTSSSDISLAVSTLGTSYGLAVISGQDSPPTPTGFASYALAVGGVTVYDDSLTTGSRTVPLTASALLMLTPNVTFTSPGTSTDEAQVSPVPEPSTFVLLAGILGLFGYARRRRRAA
jgi:PEP-CTERM motif